MSSRQEKRTDACGVVVVGAGLTGAAVAARLARDGFDSAVLEAQTVAGGATGHSIGMVLAGLPGHYNWAVAAYGRSRAREAWTLTVEGRTRLIESANRLGVPVEHTGSLALAVEEAEVEAMAESAELLGEDGFDVQLELTDPLNRGFLAALRQPDDVTVDVPLLARRLLAESGASVHERTEVHSLEPEREGVRIWAQGRTVLCDAVVLAIDGYAPLFDAYFAGKVVPTRGLVFTTEPLDGVRLAQPCSADYGYEYCRQLPNRRLCIGGWRRPAQSGELQSDPDDPVRDGLIRFTTRYFPDVEIDRIDQRSGTMGFTPDGLPLVGWLPHLPRVYFAVGLGGRGLAWTFVIADRLVELMVHNTDPGILSAARLG